MEMTLFRGADKTSITCRSAGDRRRGIVPAQVVIPAVRRPARLSTWPTRMLRRFQHWSFHPAAGCGKDRGDLHRCQRTHDGAVGVDASPWRHVGGGPLNVVLVLGQGAPRVKILTIGSRLIHGTQQMTGEPIRRFLYARRSKSRPRDSDGPICNRRIVSGRRTSRPGMNVFTGEPHATSNSLIEQMCM